MDSEELLRGFRRERQILASLAHSNIAMLLDGGTMDDGAPYFVMEYIKGQAVDEWMAAHQLTLRARVALFLTVCSAVDHAHRNLVVHGDIKPGNILVTEEGVPKLLDFGVSKTDDEGASKHPVGTPAYMSPEQANGETDVDERTDLWSLGVVLHEALTGDKPFAAPTYAALLSRIAEQPPEPLPPSIPEPVAAVVARCLAKPRHERYPNAAALHDALVAAVDAIGGASIVERAEELPPLSARGTLRSASESLAPSIRPARARSTRPKA